MPCRRAPLELTADAKLETISRSRSEPLRDASDHAACLRARRSRARDLGTRRSGVASTRRSSLARWRRCRICRDRGVRRRFRRRREPGLWRWLVKSRKTWVMRRSCGR